MVSLVRIVAGRLAGAKPLFESMLAYCQLDTSAQIPVKFESKYINLIQENKFENVVYKMAAICLSFNKLRLEWRIAHRFCVSLEPKSTAVH